MNYTTNYQLNQWAKSDRVLMEDFNRDNEKIDAALGTIPKIIAGTYQGDGNDNREITLGVRPKGVLVCTEYGIMWTPSAAYGGLALRDAPIKAQTNTGMIYDLVTITDTGFKLRQPGNSYIQGNASNTVYHYIAFC